MGLLPLLVSASPFYDYKIVAKSGNTIDGFAVQSFKRLVSINDHGHVAFIAEAAGGRKAVFMAEPSRGGYALRKLTETSSGDYLSVWVNNRDEVAASFSAVSQGITSANVRRYAPDGSGAYAITTIAKATTARRTVTVDPCLPFASCPFTQRFRVEAFDDIVGHISINDTGMVAYTALAVLDTGQRFFNLTAQRQYQQTNDPFGVVPYQLFSTLPDFQPVIANTGEIVARVGNRPDAPILLYSSGLDSPQAIAGAASFTELGQSPGLSEDGQVVAFYGNLKPEKIKQITVQNGEVVPLPSFLKSAVQNV